MINSKLKQHLVKQKYLSNLEQRDTCACPYCGSVSENESVDLEFSSTPLAIGHGIITHAHYCKDCHKSWNDIYTLIDVVLDDAESLPPFKEVKFL